jgi:hypothetical protein
MSRDPQGLGGPADYAPGAVRPNPRCLLTQSVGDRTFCSPRIRAFQVNLCFSMVSPIRFSLVDPLLNPYRPGAGTPPPALLGRDELIDEFGTTVRRALTGRPGKSLMPIGLRGVGKTVLLNRFSEIAGQKGLEVGFIEAPEGEDFKSLLANRLRKILLALDRGGASTKILRALRVLKSFSIQTADGTKFRN